jgi:ribonuclease J
MKNSAPRITFHDGIGTIGGTKIAIEESGYRVLFDFGLTYAPGHDFWGRSIQPRSGTARLRDMLNLGYIPRVDGLYRPADIAPYGLEPCQDEKTQVFISHLHLDHMGIVDMLADNLPVWMHEETLRLFHAVADTGENPPVPLGARPFTWGQPINVGPIQVTPVAVDHDIPGASALLIKTSAGTVVYSGDLRTHGAHPERVEAFVAKAMGTNPRILLLEGTRIGEGEPSSEYLPMSEPEVGAHISALAHSCKGLALITLYPRNTERITAIVTALATTNRTLVLSPEAAHIWSEMGGDLSRIHIYSRHRDQVALAEGTAPPWLIQLFINNPPLGATTIAADQQRYLLQLSPGDINELVDLYPAAGSVFIHSNGEPLGTFDPAYELFMRWLNHFGIELVRGSCSGHATAAALNELVGRIKPDLFMPIHSLQPELFSPAGVRRILPEIGATYDIRTGEQIR